MQASAEKLVPYKGLLVDCRSFLEHLEVVLLIACMLVQNEQVRTEKADHEPQVELADDAHLREVLLHNRQ